MRYGNLEVEMTKEKVTIEAIANALGIHRNSAANKVYGRTHFSIEEAEKVQKTFFPGREMSYLFERTA